MADVSGPARRDTGFDRLICGLAVVAGVGLCLLTLLVCADVAARYFRLFAMPWSLDVAEYSIYAITFLGAPWVLLRRGHISIDILVDRLSTAGKRRMLMLANALGALVCGSLLVASANSWWLSYSSATKVHETFVFPEWWLFVLPPPIFLLLMLIFLRWLREPPETTPAASADGL